MSELSDWDLSLYRHDITEMLLRAHRGVNYIQHELVFLGMFQSFVLNPLQFAQRDAAYIGLDISVFVAAIEREYPSYFFRLSEAIYQAPSSGTSIVDLMRLAESAKQCSLILGGDAEERVASLLAETYNAYLAVRLGKATDLAQKGDMWGFRLELDNARTCAKHCLHKDVNQQIGEIERGGYEKALPLQLTKAAYCASEGSISFKAHLDAAAVCANKLGTPLDARVVAEINTEARTKVVAGYFNTINSLLETTDEGLGVKSVLWEATHRLGDLRQFAHNSGVDITERVARLYQSPLYQSALDRELKKVEHYIRTKSLQYDGDGKFPLEFHYLNHCKEYAKRAGIDISARVVAIERIIVSKVQAHIAKENCNGCRDFLDYFSRCRPW